MKRKPPFFIHGVLLLLPALSLHLSTFAQGTAFTYQGRLNDNGAPYAGNAEFKPTLWSAANGGTALATNSPSSVIVPVTNGLFVLPLDFGANFPGEDRWLQLEVRTALGAFTILAPRQKFTPTPYAITASNLSGLLPAAQLTGALSSAQLAGVYSNPVTLTNAANVFSGNGSGLTALDASQLTSGTVPAAALSNAWKISGNSGTTSGTHFLGTIDNQPLEFRANNVRAFRLEYATNQFGESSPNVVGGAGNFVGANSAGAAIGGGSGNSVSNNTFNATIGGGYRNTTTNNFATVGGGYQNFASGNFNGTGDSATVAGGYQNAAVGNNAAVGGGALNFARGDNSAIAGGWLNTNQTGFGFIGGGQQNTIESFSRFSVIAGGDYNTVRSNSPSSIISGGQSNLIGNNATFAMILGGYSNEVHGAYGAAGGRRAKARHPGAFVWADSANADFASTSNNQFLVRAGGGVGIGTTNPLAQLHVNNAGGDSFPQAQFNQQGFDYSRLRLTVSNLYDGRWDIGAYPTDFVIYSGFYGERLRLNNSGMTVAGTISSAGFNGSGNATFGTVTAGSFSGNGAGVTNLDLTINSSNAITANSRLFTLTHIVGVGQGPYAVAVADLNADGHPDLISANITSDTLSIRTNHGNGQFSSAGAPTVGNAPSDVTAADVNSDGHIDLISADSGSGFLSLLTNNGSGGFGAATALSLSPGGGPRSVAAADVNGDGRIDLISANGSGSLSVLTNNGSGGFMLATNRPVAGGPVSVAAVDVNGDGRADLISANFNANTLAVLTNNGSGAFPFITNFAVGVGPQFVLAADVNNDGRPDLISANNTMQSLSVLTNNGSGIFRTNTALPFPVAAPTSVAARDINGDGHVDLIVSSLSDSLWVMTNNGNGTFTRASILNAGDAPRDVVAEDVNGDGLADLISVNSGDDTLSVFLRTPFSFLGNFVGDGSGLNLLKAASLTGTIDDERLSQNIVRLDGFQTFTGDIFFEPGTQIRADEGTAGSPGYSFNGDSNTGLFEPAPDTIAVSTGGSERMRISSSGNVGINTTNPSLAKLVVNGATSGNTAVLGSTHPVILQQSYPILGFNCYYSGSGGINKIHTAGVGGTNYAGLVGLDPYNGRMFFETSNGTTNSNENLSRFERVTILQNGNVGIGTTGPTNKLHVAGGVSATAFVNTSDRNAKENFSPVNARDVLEKVAALPITRWNFKEMPGIPHMGPMAQDFHAAFGLGGSDTTITTVDPDGVALAAIQGLNQKVNDESVRLKEELKVKDARIAGLERRLVALEKLIEAKIQKGN